MAARDLSDAENPMTRSQTVPIRKSLPVRPASSLHDQLETRRCHHMVEEYLVGGQDSVHPTDC